MVASDITPVSAWLIRGLGGLVHLIEELDREGSVLVGHWREELKSLTQRLIGVCNGQAEKASRGGSD